MYIILVYDIASANGGEKRVGKMLKHCRKYLNWIQNSVFEGEITEVKLKEMLYIARKIMNEETDSIIIFKSRDERWLDKEVIGVERMMTNNFL
ncbi:CRISPR-associated endoribonuclease Cas2 [Emticicia aquatica]|uniref:CRISPR-associated endoribonuclease Cas2 n=1 Tax=Emticicia aquatica TaxID=1681835 RepID=A0ABM9AUP0_9BACT|nr:CRISPR-associated endonuclease Cas2 [Emticicia aquatica]CAH0997760.1 CRISPR-associated endoribonuclease Cas2 [Emticicia aquatica]